ncbi:hypothetical protein FOL47_001505 [Perkinsus chesapeaki]|uniref:Uncharacterized protein n=1 Tax=Perkinsus chesapeaki TaxID=330153 RepID=A0A7J6MIR5_PERCH|nr:hypothetical protein FOL47_001505 [Perkinsus chesapeaki]
MRFTQHLIAAACVVYVAEGASASGSDKNAKQKKSRWPKLNNIKRRLSRSRSRTDESKVISPGASARPPAAPSHHADKPNAITKVSARPEDQPPILVGACDVPFLFPSTDSSTKDNAGVGAGAEVLWYPTDDRREGKVQYVYSWINQQNGFNRLTVVRNVDEVTDSRVPMVELEQCEEAVKKNAEKWFRSVKANQEKITKDVEDGDLLGASIKDGIAPRIRNALKSLGDAHQKRTSPLIVWGKASNEMQNQKTKSEYTECSATAGVDGTTITIQVGGLKGEQLKIQQYELVRPKPWTEDDLDRNKGREISLKALDGGVSREGSCKEQLIAYGRTAGLTNNQGTQEEQLKNAVKAIYDLFVRGVDEPDQSK